MITLKAIIYTLYAQNDFKYDLQHIKDKLISAYPDITIEFIQDELDEMLYMLEEEESKIAKCYREEYYAEQQKNLLHDTT